MKIRKIIERLLNNWPAKVLSFALAVLLVYFYKINTTEERFLSIPLEVSMGSSFTASERYPTHVRISLRGSEENIFMVEEDDLKAYADFSRHREKGIYREPVIIERSGNALYADPLEIRVEPMEIILSIEEKLVRNIDVVADIKGYPAENYELSDYTLNPSFLTVEGPAKIIEKILDFKTEEINLSGRSENFILPVRIVYKNDMVEFLSGREVQFKGQIEKTLIMKTFAPVKITADNLPAGFEAAFNVQNGSLKVEAERTVLEDLTKEDFSLAVDLSEIRETGIYTMAVAPKGTGNLKVISFVPETVRVYLSRTRR